MFGAATAVTSKPASAGGEHLRVNDTEAFNSHSDFLSDRPYDPEAEFRSNTVNRETPNRSCFDFPVPRMCVRDGAASAARLLLAPLGRGAARYHRKMKTPERLANGLVILLPGIDGCTTVSDSIARGLDLPDSPMAVEVHDWRSFPGWNPLHLMTYRENRRRARRIADHILDYRGRYRDRPVHLVGHSAGAGMALFVLQALRKRMLVTSVTLLAAAVSRRFDVRTLSRQTENGIWNFWSRGDFTAAGIGTTIFGTIDRVRRPSAGAFGFCRPTAAQDIDRISPSAAERFFDVGFEWEMFKYWNWGGHFGCTNTAFIKRYVAPIVNGQVTTICQLLRSGCVPKSKRKTPARQSTF
ncbi:MAG: hypothetical protein KDA81_03595 [Planctomycetaceae bacterium]|nr:hypothetical protein [Planctomycetaceae bacterium]